MKIRTVGGELSHAERQTDGHNEARSGLSQFCERAYLSLKFFHFRANPLILPGMFWTGVRNSVVGIATHYGLEGSGFEPRLGQDFPDPFTPFQADSASGTEGTGSFSPGGGVRG
jgi:hypothetical protein